MDFSDYDFYLTQNGASKHITPVEEMRPRNGKKKWNEDNPGWGVEAKKINGNAIRGLMVGNYLNSLGEDSNYLAYLMQHRFGDENLHADLGMTMGGVTGYDIPIAPMFLPTLTLGGRNMDFNVRYQPKIQGITPEVYMMNASYRLPK